MRCMPLERRKANTQYEFSIVLRNGYMKARELPVRIFTGLNTAIRKKTDPDTDPPPKSK